MTKRKKIVNSMCRVITFQTKENKKNNDLVNQEFNLTGREEKIHETKSELDKTILITNNNINKSLNILNQELNLINKLNNYSFLTIDIFSHEKTQISKIESNSFNFDISGPSIHKQIPEYNKFFIFNKKSEALDYLYNYNYNRELQLFSEDLGFSGARRFILATKEYIFDKKLRTHMLIFTKILK